MATTLTAIHQAIHDLIEGLNPRGEIAGGETYFKPTEFGEPVHDREFLVGPISNSMPTFFGAVAEQDYDAEFDVTIAHDIGFSQPVGQQRLSEDKSTIQQALEASANFPDGVSIVRLKGDSTSEIELESDKVFWLTTLSFRLTYRLESVV